MRNDQTVIIAGATGNVGSAAALALARRGAHVVLLGRDGAALAAQADAIRSTLTAEQLAVPPIDALTIDFTDATSVRRAADEALDRFPTIDVFVHSAVAIVQRGPNVLPDGHEAMFATNVLGPFLLTQLLLERLQQSHGLIVHVVAPFTKRIDWDDLESIEHHRTGTAYNRTKTMNRVIAAELARRYGDGISSVAFDPGFVIDKHDPRLRDRWPDGPSGTFWRIMTVSFASSPEVAGEPLAELVLSDDERRSINGARFKRSQRSTKRDDAMDDAVLGRRLWDELEARTGVRTG